MEENKKFLKLGFDLDGVILLWLFFISKEAREALSSLRDQGHTIKIVTARGKPWTLWHARAVLKIYGLDWIEVIGVGRNGKKWQVLKGFDFYFDNKIHHLKAIVENLTREDGVKHLYLFGKNPRAGFKNLANWKEIGSKIEKELVV